MRSNLCFASALTGRIAPIPRARVEIVPVGVTLDANPGEEQDLSGLLVGFRRSSFAGHGIGWKGKDDAHGQTCARLASNR